MKKHVIFAGHFELGERTTSNLEECIRKAKEVYNPQIDDWGIVVNDINFYDKLRIYEREGIDGIVADYKKRQAQCDSGCVQTQLPATRESAIDRIDVKQYDLANRMLKKHRIDGSYKTEAEERKYVREIIVPKLIEEKIVEYGLKEIPVKVYHENKFRNILSKRIRKWKTYLKDKTFESDGRIVKGIEETNQDGKNTTIMMELGVIAVNNRPRCRGITLAFYEQIALEGYEKMTQYIIAEQEAALGLGKILFERVKSHLPYLKDTKLQIENIF